MHTVGKITLYIGIGLVVLGMLIGFTSMFMDSDNQAKFFLSIIPIGFVLLLTGTVMTQLSEPPDQTKK